MNEDKEKQEQVPVFRQYDNMYIVYSNYVYILIICIHDDIQKKNNVIASAVAAIVVCL